MTILKCPKCFYGLDFATLIQQFNKLSPESSLLEKMQEYLHVDDSVEPENSTEFPNMKVDNNTNPFEYDSDCHYASKFLNCYFNDELKF